VSRHRSIRFPDDLDQWIEREAKRQDRSFAWVVVHWMQLQRAQAEQKTPMEADGREPVER
jgi:hypothetical protein